MSDGLNKIAINMRESKVKEISALINTIHADMVDTDNNTIPYDVFKEYFLEFFKQGGHMDSEAPLTLKWLELAGGPYNEVDIVDGNGAIVITTPGMYCRPDIDPNVFNINYGDMMDEFNMRSNRLHADGINFAAKSLNGVSDGITTKHDEFNFRWDSVFKRYSTNPKGSDVKPLAVKEDNLDFLDFD